MIPSIASGSEPEAELVVTDLPTMEDIDLGIGAVAEGVVDPETIPSILDQMLTRARRDVTQFPDSSRAYANLGTLLATARKHQEADAAFRRAIELDGENHVARIGLGNLALRRGDVRSARDQFGAVLSARPEDPRALFGMAQIALDSNELEGARALAKRVIGVEENRARGYGLLASVYARMRKPHEAIASLKRAVLHQPRNAALRYALGVAYLSADRESRGFRHLKLAVQIDPSMGDAVRTLSKLLLGDNAIAAVTDLLSNHLESQPDDVEARDVLAAAYLRMGRYTTARSHWMRAYSVVSTSEESRAIAARIANNLGVCYERMGKPERAEHFYRHSVNTYADGGPVPFQNVVRLALSDGRYAAAQEVLAQALDRYPTDVRLQVMDAERLDRLGHWHAAVERLRSVIGQENADEAAYAFLASLLADRYHRYEEAIALTEKAEGLFGRSVRLANLLSYLYLMTDRVVDARNVLADRFDGEESNVTLVATRGLLRLKEGDLDEGRAGYERAIRLARSQGQRELAAVAKQKMHLEVSRALLLSDRLIEARREVMLGLRVDPKSSAYWQDLKRLGSAIDEGDL